MIDADQPLEPRMDELLLTRYSRFPVYRDTSDNIIGILNMKDLMILLAKHKLNEMDLESILQEPYFVPDSKPTAELFKEMQRTQNRMAILIDEYGGFSGITTIEDLIEEIVGDLRDEHEPQDPDLVDLGGGRYRIDGLMLLNDLNEELDLKLETEYYDTLSGYLIEQLGYIPELDEHPTIQVRDLQFVVESMEGKRIGKVILTIGHLAHPAEQNASAATQG